MCANKNVIIATVGIILLSMITITGCSGADKIGDKKAVQIDENAELQQEANQLKTENALQEKVVKAYEKSVTDLRLALGIIITLALATIGLLVFKNTREYKEAKDEAKEAAKEAKDIAKEAGEWADKARHKYEDMENKGDKIIEDIVKKAEAERQKSQKEAETQRRISELWLKGSQKISEGKLEESYSYWQEITSIKPDDYEAWNNWGATLIDQAQKKEGTEADRLLADACTKIQKALAIKPDYPKAWNNWGIAIRWQAKKKEGQEKRKLLQEAKKKFLTAEQAKKGNSAYNLACAAAIEGNEEDCKKWLKAGEEAGTLPARKHAMEDDDLKAYRDKEWFKAIKWKGEK